MSALRNLSPDDQARIHAAVTALEARSHCHFALVVVPVSDRYLLFPLLWGGLAAFVVAAVLAIGWPEIGLREGFLIELIVFNVASLLFDWLPLRLRLVPRRFKHSHARVLAHREFAAHILADRAQRSGMVFFVSLGERYVEIIADRRLHERVEPAAWNAVVADFTAAVGRGALADGFVAALTACGAILEQHFPKTTG